jgi:hypothetical protein
MLRCISEGNPGIFKIVLFLYLSVLDYIVVTNPKSWALNIGFVKNEIKYLKSPTKV